MQRWATWCAMCTGTSCRAIAPIRAGVPRSTPATWPTCGRRAWPMPSTGALSRTSASIWTCERGSRSASVGTPTDSRTTSMRLNRFLPGLSFLLLAGLLLSPARADEGMWTYDNFPAATVKQKLGVEITPAWLDRVRMATIRLSNCTASFVSPDGLILTNHHCAAACLAQLSTAGDDKWQKAAGTRDPRRCESVRLYEGGQYFLYQYKRYADVRLVFAPEDAVAAFGGDPDNFQFPRWCLDMSVLRAYENGKPAATPNHLKVNWNGPAAGEAVFVTGHPGSTDRLLTIAQLETLRASLPFWLLRSAELRGRYLQFSKTSAENARIVADPLNSLENSIKVRRKQLDALLDPSLMAQKAAAEKSLRAQAGAIGGSDPWQVIERASHRELELSVPYTLLESAAGFNSALFRYARTLVRAAAERSKPS